MKFLGYFKRQYKVTNVGGLPESALGVGSVLEGIENLLQRNFLFGVFVDGFPHNAIGTFAQLCAYLVLPQHELVNLVVHLERVDPEAENKVGYLEERIAALFVGEGLPSAG